MKTPPQPPFADGPESQAEIDFPARRRGQARLWDRKIAAVASRQYGLASVDQLRRIGLSKQVVGERVEAGRLHRIHHGVYAVGHPLVTRNGHFLAAVLACGSRAVLSHRSAAALWGLRDYRRSAIDVTAPNRRGRIPNGIDAHRDGSLTAAERTELHGIPCTTVARTLLDLAAVVPVGELRKAISEAEVSRLLDKGAVRRLIERSRGRRGVARLRMILDDIHPQTRRTRSELERLFLRMCTRAGLPEPEVNVKLDVDGRLLEPDFLWREAGLILEADSRRFHDTDSAFQLDRKREQSLMLAGWQVARCTWEQVDREPRRLAGTIHRLLQRAESRDGPGTGSRWQKPAQR